MAWPEQLRNEREQAGLGCCSLSQSRFRRDDGSVDQKRWGTFAEMLRRSGAAQAAIEKMQKCECLCHQDNRTCLC